MSASIKNIKQLFFCFVCLALVAGCKKDADIPLEVRGSDFWVHCTITESSGQELPFVFAGEDMITVDSFVGADSYSFEVYYECTYGITAAQTKYIRSTITDGFVSSLFNITLRHPEPVTDPLLPPEWNKSELEAVLVPGAVFELGDGPGQAVMFMRFFGDTAFHTTSPLHNGTLRLLEVEDYGSPEAAIPYFGKRARFQFNGAFYNGNNLWEVSNGEAVLFFRYFNY